ncbi:hypothetical protein SVAN01_02978 [Stagonosporopsis vannaccii]|nr:hypothetical protein SVAN01_02978 [Stagonosporopsis vannaccii]
MTATTLLQCFFQHLPDITIKSSSNASQPRESSRTVKDEPAPRILITDIGKQYFDIAQQYLRDNCASLDQEYVGIPEPNPEILNEADVVSHARFNLVHPVVRALEHAKLAGTIKICSELRTEPLRVDLGVAYTSKEGRRIVMMIEYKRAHVINPARFKAAMYLTTTSSELKLIKQAKAYARRAECLYVALCDYESLILLKFSNDLSVIDVTIVYKTDVKFRVALLGFLLTAVEHYKDKPVY